MTGLESLINFIISILDKLLFFWIIKEFDNGVLLRFGKYKKTLKPGIHFKIPLVDEVITHHVVTSLLSIPAQSLTTKDGKQLVVKGIVKYRVEDVKPLLLEVWDSTDAISDITQSIIKKQIHIRTWEQCTEDDLDNEITKKLRVEVRKWGISIDNVTMTDMGITKSLRLYNETLEKNKDG